MISLSLSYFFEALYNLVWFHLNWLSEQQWDPGSIYQLLQKPFLHQPLLLVPASPSLILFQVIPPLLLVEANQPLLLTPANQPLLLVPASPPLISSKRTQETTPCQASLNQDKRIPSLPNQVWTRHHLSHQSMENNMDLDFAFTAFEPSSIGCICIYFNLP